MRTDCQWWTSGRPNSPPRDSWRKDGRTHGFTPRDQPGPRPRFLDSAPVWGYCIGRAKAGLLLQKAKRSLRGSLGPAHSHIQSPLHTELIQGTISLLQDEFSRETLPLWIAGMGYLQGHRSQPFCFSDSTPTTNLVFTPYPSSPEHSSALPSDPVVARRRSLSYLSAFSLPR